MICFHLYINNIFKLCLSHATVDSDLSSDDASVKAEAIHNCFDKRWCSFICILAVSSVVNKTIFTFYPDFGDVKYKLLFTQEVKPRLGSSKGVVNKVGHFNPVLRSHPIISSH